MRNLDQITEAHDLIVCFLLHTPESIQEELGADTMAVLVHSADVLCWLLGHDHNPRFAAKLTALRDLLLADADAVVDCNGYTN